MKEESIILDEMKKAFKHHKKFDYQLYCECKKYCDAYGIEQLYHVKAILEERKVYGSENNVGISIVLSMGATAIACIGVWFSGVSGVTKSQLDLSCVIGALIIWLFAMVLVVYDRVINPHRKDAYFYSIICDEIDRRK